MKKIFGGLTILAVCIAVIAPAGCLKNQAVPPSTSTTPAATTPVTTASPVVPTAQEVLNYVNPWLNAAENIAKSLCAGSNSTECSDVTTASTTANLAVAALASTPTTANIQAVQTAMAPIYKATIANAPATTSTTPAAAATN
jgi:hypothetical protein